MTGSEVNNNNNNNNNKQKSALPPSAHILWKVLEVWGLGMRLDWIFLPRENPCAKFYLIICKVQLRLSVSSETEFSDLVLCSYSTYSLFCEPVVISQQVNTLVHTEESQSRSLRSLNAQSVWQSWLYLDFVNLNRWAIRLNFVSIRESNLYNKRK